MSDHLVENSTNLFCVIAIVRKISFYFSLFLLHRKSFHVCLIKLSAVESYVIIRNTLVVVFHVVSVFFSHLFLYA